MKTVLGVLVLGVGLLTAGPVSAASILVNGDFETGDFTGWTIGFGVNTNQYFGVGNTRASGFPVSHFYPHTGVNAAWFGDVNGGVIALPGNGDDAISQTFATVPGQHYLIDFWLAEDGPSCAADFRCGSDTWYLLWDGALIHRGAGLVNLPYTEYTFDVVATSMASTLRFAADDLPGFIDLDDISVTAVSDLGPVADVPEPASLLLLGSGLLGLVIARRRRDSPTRLLGPLVDEPPAR